MKTESKIFATARRSKRSSPRTRRLGNGDDKKVSRSVYGIPYTCMNICLYSNNCISVLFLFFYFCTNLAMLSCDAGVFTGVKIICCCSQKLAFGYIRCS